jgi:hypothetical protein
MKPKEEGMLFAVSYYLLFLFSEPEREEKRREEKRRKETRREE